MIQSNKLNAFLTLGLAVLFYFFFQFTKHNHYLYPVNVFNQDPYDAVGSFGVLLAFFASFVALFWVWKNNKEKQLQSAMIAVFSAVVTLLADVIALLKYIPTWIASSSGLVLAVFTLGMLLVSSLLGLYIFSSEKMSLNKNEVKNAWIVSVISGLGLLIYQKQWDEGLLGGIGTITVGMIILFIVIWVWMRSLFPSVKINFRLKVKKLIWVILGGLLLGLLLFLAEAFGEGIRLSGKIPLTLIAIFLGFAGSATLLAYFLLSDFLGFNERR